MSEPKASVSSTLREAQIPPQRNRKEATVITTTSKPSSQSVSVNEKQQAWTFKNAFRLFGRSNKRKPIPETSGAPFGNQTTTTTSSTIEATSTGTNAAHNRSFLQAVHRKCNTKSNKSCNVGFDRTNDILDLRDPAEGDAPTIPLETTVSDIRTSQHRLKDRRGIVVQSACNAPTTASHSDANSSSYNATVLADRARTGENIGLLMPKDCSATAILQHSYFEYLCGGSDSGRKHDNDEPSVYDSTSSSLGATAPVRSQDQLYAGRTKLLSDDPTIQESFECVFERQLRAGLAAKLMEEDEGEWDQPGPQSSLTAPSQLQQTLLRSRSFTYKAGSQHHTPRQSLRKPRKVQHHVSLHRINAVSEAASSVTAPVDQATQLPKHPASCHCQNHTAPIVPPQLWPQGQLLMRPTPGSGVRIRGIRFAKATSSSYLWQASDYPSGQSPVTWPQALQDHWKEANVRISATAMPKGHDELLQRLQSYRVCPNCMILPVNNGNEPDGESLVTDFESDLFVGTMLVRLRHTLGTTPEPYNDQIGYFVGMNRRYQVVMRGRFKRSIPWTRCVAGLELTRKTARLPAKYVVKGAMKVIGFFAPQLDARLEGSHPHSLTPLGSTAQSLRVQRNTPSSIENNYDEFDLEAKLEEPTRDEETLLGKASSASTTMSRARFRKKGFDKVFASKEASLRTNPEDIYTFEFLQHLFNFQEFSIELSSLFGSIHLQDCLDGQPLQIVAKHKDSNNTRLWSFDVWHECLYREAVAFDERNCD
jgi:hypothetical protein